jgi:hypothetical protein
VCGLEFVDERGLASANVALDGNQSVGVGHLNLRGWYTFFRALWTPNFPGTSK